jgi:single-stranded-DNA-specific exonuclease
MLAEKLESINGERQLIMRDAVTHASSEIRSRRSTKKILIIANEEYEEGIIGLVAGRLVEEYYLPAIVIARGEKTSKGSVRSISGFNIIEFLRSQQDLFINVGGHPMAAGFTLMSENIEILQTTLEDRIQELLTEEQLQKKVKIDLELSFNDISEELASRISTLSPFGMGNFEPTFVSRQVLVREKRLLGKERKHLRLVLQGGELGKVIEAIAFGMGDRISEIPDEGYIDIVYTVGINEWNGSKRLQIKLKDFKVS